MESRSVSRCVAIAAHGKRCQQSPFRGSPYCWHHTQSRKIWAPSRPLNRGGGARSAEGVEATATVDDTTRTVSEDRAGWAGEDAAARRLADLLGPEKVVELLDFLETAADGAYLLVRDEGGLLSERSISERPVRRRSA